MKKKILLASASSGGLATVLGLAAVSGDFGKAIGYAMCFGLLSIALFFVGLAYPVK